MKKKTSISKTAKKIAKKVLKAKPEKIRTTIEAHFSFVLLSMDKDFKWRLKMRVDSILPEMYYRYDLKMILDEEPYERRIEDLQTEIKKLTTGQTMLLKDVENSKREELEEKVEQEKANLEDMRERCKDIEFPASMEVLKYGILETIVTFRIPDDIIERLNAQKTLISYYKIRLIPFVDLK